MIGLERKAILVKLDLDDEESLFPLIKPSIFSDEKEVSKSCLRILQVLRGV